MYLAPVYTVMGFASLLLPGDSRQTHPRLGVGGVAVAEDMGTRKLRVSVMQVFHFIVQAT